ncbi:MAG: DUF3604 domain-containing protein [Promethearchaeati archaeon SRVP18_Atabeyarchaeia-1]
MPSKPKATKRDPRRRVLFLVRLVILVYGFYTTTFFFQSYIGLAIGASYFLLFRNPTWRLSGVVLAWTAGITTVIINVFSDPAVGSNISANLLSMIMGPSTLIVYIVLFGSWRLWQRRSLQKPSITDRVNGIARKMPKYAKVAAVLTIVLVPTALWWSASINLGVMFDNNPRLLWVHAPTTVNAGTSFPLSVEAWDPYERLSAVYAGTVAFSIKSYNLTTFSPLPSVGASLPETYTFSGQAYGNDMAYDIRDGRDNGLHVFTAKIDTPGVHYILVNDTVTMNTYWSNPIIVGSFSSVDPKIYWGDFHGHSGLSDGTGSPEHHYYYARYVACLDYCALTDHGETMQFELGALAHSEGATNAAYDPGSFVALQGVEWTQTSTGHYTCIFSGDSLPDNPIISYMTIPTTQGLWSLLDAFTNSTGCRALALPHHTTKLGYIQDWTYINPKYVKIAEVTSVHGESLFEQRDPLDYNPCGDPPPLYTPGTCIMDAFKMGYRMTLYASGDNHDGHPGHSLAHTDAYIGHQRPWTTWPNRISMPYPSGITAVYAINLTRNSVFDGLENQRIFASSDYGRPFIDFTINGTRVGDGSTLKVTSASTAREITIVVAQDGAPAANKRPGAAHVTPNWTPDWNANIEVFKNGNLTARIPISTPVANITLIDTAPVAGTSYGVQNCVQIDGKYYINIYSDNPIDPSKLNTGGADFYLIRVVGANGRIAYAGPIWVEVSP